jgi:hypothetical protein
MNSCVRVGFSSNLSSTLIRIGVDLIAAAASWSTASVIVAENSSVYEKVKRERERGRDTKNKKRQKERHVTT